jgi:hypothetical protein
MTVGSILGGGFRLLKERPGVVAAWALVYFALTVATALATRFLLAPMAGAAAGAGDVVRVVPARPVGVPGFGANFGLFLLLELVVLVVAVVLMAAVQRAVLYPERRGLAYLRLGMDELRLFALALILIVLFYAGFLVVGIVLVLVAGLVTAVLGVGAMAPLVIVEGIGLLVLLLVFEVRLALAFPLTLLRGRIIIGEAWRVTRGHFWQLFAAFLVLGLLVLALWLVSAAVTNGGYLSELMRGGFNPVSMQRAANRQLAEQLGVPSGMTVLGWILAAAAGTLSITLFGGAIATAARELTGNPSDVAETFA